MKLNAITAASLLVVSLSGSATAAFAQAAMAPATNAEAQAQYAATISASEALKAAEGASGGKVVELSLEVNGSMPGYRITVVAQDGTETNYLVDATTGAATLFLEDNGDENGIEGQDENGSQGQNENGDEGQQEGGETN